MKFFLDTANLKEIREANSLGVLDGITTNPTLVSKEGGVDFKEHVRAICEIVDGPVSAEVVATEADGMIEEGHSLAAIHPNVVVKVPITREGLKAITALSRDGIRINTTLIFSPTQALLAAKAGAAFVSPFVGRLDDISAVGMDLVRDIIQIFDQYEFDCEVLVASIRHPIHIIEAAKAGADIATMPYSVLEQLIKHPLTDIGLAKFLADWKKVQK